MLTLSDMLIRLLIAFALGALLGFERQVVGKEAGIRTAMLVSGGSAIFAMIGLMIPDLFHVEAETLSSLPDRVISNIVVGVGFLGAGLILKTKGHIHGLTTAADIWIAAAVGTLAGLNLAAFAFSAAILTAGLLYLTRKFNIDKHLDPSHAHGHNHDREEV